MKIEDLPCITASHLVKSVDLNHHGTLFAGRMAEWLVETGFMTARAALGCAPENLVCVHLHGMDFRRSIPEGATLVLESCIAHVGRSSITVYVTAGELLGGKHAVGTEGYVTFVHVREGQAVSHGLEVVPPETSEARRRWELILAARKQRRNH
ncbi:MAG: acyl-CoA thioesterase [Anaerolineae bacterium]